MSSPIDSQQLLAFLDRLGKCYHHAGTLYLVGGSSLLLLAAKESTLDIDLTFEIAPVYETDFIRCLRQLSREMAVSIEQASPAEFIPLPQGYQDRRKFIGHFGALEVFHFDLYSIALSKLHRGNEKDFADVLNMLTFNLITFETLAACFQETWPKVETFNLRADPEGFRLRFEWLKREWEKR